MGSVKRISNDVEATANDRSGRKVSRQCEHPSLPPDGGLHAWFIVFASFLTNGIVFGIHNCYGIIYLRLKTHLEQAGVNEAALKACKSFLSIITNHFALFTLSLRNSRHVKLFYPITALVGSLSIGMTFFVSPIAGILIDSIGLRRTAVLGGAIATVGMLASSFALAHVSDVVNVCPVLLVKINRHLSRTCTGRSIVPNLRSTIRRRNIIGLQSIIGDFGTLLSETFGICQRFGDSRQFSFHLHVALLPRMDFGLGTGGHASNSCGDDGSVNDLRYHFRAETDANRKWRNNYKCGRKCWLFETVEKVH